MSRSLPSAVKKLRGTAQPCRTNDFEPVFPSGNLPEPPAWIIGPSLVEWNRLVEPLQKSGVITDIDFTTLVVYCKMFGEFVEAVEAKESLKRSKLMAIKAYASDLGITPASRSGVMATKPKGNAFNGF